MFRREVPSLRVKVFLVSLSTHGPLARSVQVHGGPSPTEGDGSAIRVLYPSNYLSSPNIGSPRSITRGQSSQEEPGTLYPFMFASCVGKGTMKTYTSGALVKQLHQVGEGDVPM